MANKDMIRVTKYSFGLYTHEKAAEYLEVSYSTVVDAIKKGYLPDKYANKLFDMGKRMMLPIDEPPSEQIIGVYAHRAIKSLMRGDFIQAVAQCPATIRFAGGDN